MGRFLPGAILAVFGGVAYTVGCLLYLAQRRQRDPNAKSKTLFVYAIVLGILGIMALAAGLYSMEMTQIRALSG
jgi:predicted membrane channel-forming protein YqfA (hemolysin III family)